MYVTVVLISDKVCNKQKYWLLLKHDLSSRIHDLLATKLFLLSSAFTIGHGQELDVIVDVDCSTFNVTSAGGCMELDEALANIVSGTTLYLLPGTHTIHNSTILKDMSNISIIGQPEDCEDGEITITCLEGRGLLFSQISGLVLKDLTISECGAMGEALNETINMVYDRVQFVVFISPFIRIAVFMGLCENVGMENVTVTNTTGIGLVGVNIFGQSWMHGVDFTYN